MTDKTTAAVTRNQDKVGWATESAPSCGDTFAENGPSQAGAALVGSAGATGPATWKVSRGVEKSGWRRESQEGQEKLLNAPKIV